jgi:hypothetical protein
LPRACPSSPHLAPPPELRAAAAVRRTPPVVLADLPRLPSAGGRRHRHRHPHSEPCLLSSFPRLGKNRRVTTVRTVRRSSPLWASTAGQDSGRCRRLPPRVSSHTCPPPSPLPFPHLSQALGSPERPNPTGQTSLSIAGQSPEVGAKVAILQITP